jgi:tetratricopeptide (TPR) repeat protein
LYAAGRLEAAATLAREVLADWDSSAMAQRVLAFSALKLGHGEDAIELLRESVEQSNDAFLVRSLAQLLIMEHQYAEAEQVLEVYKSVAPDDGRVPLLRGDCMARQNRLEEAITLYERAIEIDEHRTGIRARARIERIRQEMGQP